MTLLPEIQTKRLVLRPIEMTDASRVAELAGKDFQVARWFTSSTWPYEEGTAEAFIEKMNADKSVAKHAVFAVTQDDLLIGVAALTAPGEFEQLAGLPSLGYWLGRDYQGQGFASEALIALIDWGFEFYGTKGIAARVFEENFRSRNLLRRLGFEPYGKIELFSKILDRRVPNVIVRLKKETFFKKRDAA